MRFRTKSLDYCKSWPFSACRFQDKSRAALFKTQMDYFICGKIPVSFWSALQAWDQFSSWGPQEVTLIVPVPELKSLAPSMRSTWPVLREVLCPLCRSPWASLWGGDSFRLLYSSSKAALRYAVLQCVGTGRQAVALAQDEVRHGGYAPKFVLGEDVTHQIHQLCTTRGFPDPGWPIKPALQLSITGVCKVALLLFRIWLQGVTLA